MIFYIIPGVTLLASVIGLAALVLRKFTQLASINVESIAGEQNAKARNKILLERLMRKAAAARRLAHGHLKPIGMMIKDRAQRVYERAREIEKETLKKAQPLKKIDLNQEIRDKLSEVERLVSIQEYQQAEDVAISVVVIDSENLDAYEHLVDIYVAEKEYKKARETARFLLKLLQKAKKTKLTTYSDHRLANCYANLGMVYDVENRKDYALINIKKAVELQPNNPRFLDFLLKISIMLKDKSLAFETFNSLKESDPDNQKLPDLEQQIYSIDTSV